MRFRDVGRVSNAFLLIVAAGHMRLCVFLLSVFMASAVLSQAAPETPPPGDMVEVFGHTMHIRCIGEDKNGPTVILEAGGGAYSSAWSDVQTLLPPTIRACAYDRAGSGWSEPGPAPRTMRQEAFELHELLRVAAIDGPYIYVGHSIGGLLARVYLREYPDDVAGLVLVDPPDEGSMVFSLGRNAWVRLRELSTGKPVPDPVESGAPPGNYDAAQDFLGEEAQQLLEARLANPQPFGDRPLIVLGAGVRPTPPGTDEAFYEEVRQEAFAMRAAMASLSANGKSVLVAESGHNIHQEQPQVVANVIAEVYSAVTEGAQLEPVESGVSSLR